jgi:hypothetical protein
MFDASALGTVAVEPGARRRNPGPRRASPLEDSRAQSPRRAPWLPEPADMVQTAEGQSRPAARPLGHDGALVRSTPTPGLPCLSRPRVRPRRQPHEGSMSEIDLVKRHPRPAPQRSSTGRPQRRERIEWKSVGLVGARGVDSAEPTSSPSSQSACDGGATARTTRPSIPRAQVSAPRRRRSSSRRRRLLGRPSPRTSSIAGPASGTTGGLWST